MIFTIFKLAFYGYLNLESTKTNADTWNFIHKFYGYLNLESTKTAFDVLHIERRFTVT